jgi:hypothetical protein
MGRTALLLAASVLLLLSAGCASKFHAPEVDTADIEAMGVVVSQEAGQPLSLTLVESEVTGHLYRRFRLYTGAQLAGVVGERHLSREMLLDPDTCARLERETGIDAVLEVTVTSHEIQWSRTGQDRAHVALAMQLIDIPDGLIRWSRSAKRTGTSETISGAVHEATSSAVWDCLKYLVGWESIVKREELIQQCARTGLTLTDEGRYVVERVERGSVWEKAGLREGDEIVSVAGAPVGAEGLQWPGDRPAESVCVSVRRGDSLIEVAVPGLTKKLLEAR